MSYMALARKWRPRTFSQLVGQEHVNKALINALEKQRLHHAYLFTGTRGVGKTSVARILAKALNCEQGISAEPCLQCDACLAIEQGRFIDLIEIDGASKTRVEDTRELLDNVQYATTSGRFKIYLIDEVHMLSQHSFNALLKTLEEPPEHVKFILATTDPQKLPVTVLSRCLQFHLRHLLPEVIRQQLQLILNEESLTFDSEALDILAQAAQGSMRDALSLLDQAITSCPSGLTAHEVKAILGYTQQDYAIRLLECLGIRDASKLFEISQHIATEGGHFQYVLTEMLQYLHQIAIYQSIGDANHLIDSAETIKQLAQQLAPEDIQLFYQIGLKGCDEIHIAPTLTIGFNMTLLRMFLFRPAPEATLPSLTFPRIEPIAPPQIDKRLNEEECSTMPIMPEVKHAILQENTTPIAPDTSSQKTPPSTNEHTHWEDIIPSLKLTGLALNAMENTEYVAQDERTISIRVAKGHQSLFTPTVISRIEQALSAYYQKPQKLVLIFEEVLQASPAQQKEKATQQKQLHAESALHEDPLVQHIQQEFSAELVKNSIVPLKDGL